MAPQATPNRALFKHPNGPASPLAPGSRLASGTNTSSITISPVLEARRLILPSIFGKERPGHPRSRMKPRMISSSVFAHIIVTRSEDHTSELQSLMRISYAVFYLKHKNTNHSQNHISQYLHH